MHKRQFTAMSNINRYTTLNATQRRNLNLVAFYTVVLHPASKLDVSTATPSGSPCPLTVGLCVVVYLNVGC